MNRRSVLGLGALVAVVLPDPTGVDDTAVINDALAGGGLVEGRPGATYRISAPLDLMVSGTTLSLSVVLLPGSDCNMLRNASGGRLTDITIAGGSWDRGANAGGGNNRHSLFLRHVDRLTVRGVRVTSTGGKYAIAVGDATEVRVHDISLDTASDGVHITGPASQVDIRGISGTTGDDQVALTARDWAVYDDVHGDITGVTIDGVYGDNSLAAVKIISGTGTEVRGVSVRGIFGTFRIRPIAIIDDTTGPTVADGVTIADVDVAIANPTYSAVWLRGLASTDITIRDVRLRSSMTSNLMVLIDRTTSIGSLTIDGVLVDPAAVTNASVVGVFGTAHVGVLRLSRVRIPAGLPWTGLPIKVGGTATVGTSSATDVATY